MIRTISRPGFAWDIISRYTAALPDGQPPAEMLLESFAKPGGMESPLTQNIRNIRFINQLITENNIFHINTSLRFPAWLIGKAVWEIGENVSRRVGMLGKTHGSGSPRFYRTGHSGNTPVLLQHRQAPAALGESQVLESRDPALRGTKSQIKLQNKAEHPSAMLRQKSQSGALDRYAREPAKGIPSPVSRYFKETESIRETLISLPGNTITAGETFRAKPDALRELSFPGRHADAGIPVRYRRGWSMKLQDGHPYNETVYACYRAPWAGYAMLTPQCIVEEERNAPSKLQASPVFSAFPVNARGQEEGGSNPSSMNPVHSEFSPSFTLSRDHGFMARSFPDNISARGSAMISPPGPPLARLVLPVRMEQRKDNIEATRPEVGADIAPSVTESQQNVAPTGKIASLNTANTAVHISPSLSPMRFDIEPSQALALIHAFRYPNSLQEPDVTVDKVPATEIGFLRPSGGNAAASAQRLLKRGDFRHEEKVPGKPPSRLSDKPDMKTISIPTAPGVKYYGGNVETNEPANQRPAAFSGAARALLFPERGGLPPMGFIHAPQTQRVEDSHLPGASIVYRKEENRRQERQPASPRDISEDIEFIKKTVKQPTAIAQTQKSNVAINMPRGANGAVSPEASDIRDLDRQANEIADRVYGVLERRLRSERMRRGLF